MTASHLGGDPVRLDVGGLGIDLHISGTGIAHRIRERYRNYQPAVEERFQVDIELLTEPPFATLLTFDINFEGGVLKYNAPGCQGYIDAGHRLAHMRLSTTQPLEEVDYLLRTVCALQAFDTGGLLLHAAGVIHRGRAYVFFGYSGSGKSTITQLSSPDQVINDDLLILMPSSGGWTAHTTPFWNSFQSQPLTAPAAVGGLYRLVQDTRVYLEPISPALAIAELVSSSPVISADRSRSHALLLRCQKILDTMNAHRLHFVKDDSFWELIDQQRHSL